MPIWEWRGRGVEAERRLEGVLAPSHGSSAAWAGRLVTVGHEFHDTFREGPCRMSPGHDLALHIL